MSNINLAVKAIDTDILWDIVQWEKGYKLEKNRITGHCRILDNSGVRVSSGSYEKMCLLIDHLIKPWKSCNRGDIVAVPRCGGLYAHYGVYAGYGKIIHFGPVITDGKEGEPTIHKADFSEFLLHDTSFDIVHFPENGTNPVYESIDLSHDMKRTTYVITDIFSDMKASSRMKKGYHIYNAQETIERAISRIGESKYNLAFNNCEHFAIWCKTGLKESMQVEDFWKRILLGKSRVIETDMKDLRKLALA